MSEQAPHILVLSSWYPTEEHPFLGNFVERHAQLLSRKYEVTVINTQHGDDYSIQESNNKDFREIRSYHPQGKGLLDKRKCQTKAIDQALELIGSVDLIIGHIILPKGLQFIYAKKKLKCPLILVEHASYYRPAKKSERTWLEKIIIRTTRKHIDEVIAVSEFLKKDLANDFPGKHINVIGNHIDESAFMYQPKKKSDVIRFLHVSTMDERTKNPEGILCTLKGLLEDHLNFSLTIVCDEDTSRWKELAGQLGLEDHVRFVGPLNWEDVAPYYHEADAFLLFSDYESFSIVLAEAWATGTPVITTKVGIAFNMPEFLGKAIEVGNNKQLLASLEQFIESKGEGYDGEKIAEYAQRFYAKAILEKWEKCIERHVG